MFTTKEGGKAGVPTQKGTVSLETELGLKPNSLAILFLDFFGFALFSLAASSTQLISSMHACITSALNKLMFLLRWVLPPRSPCCLVPFGMSGHFTLCAIFKRHENKSIKIYLLGYREARSGN